jgi:hypothetical protein
MATGVSVKTRANRVASLISNIAAAQGLSNIIELVGIFER